MNGIPIKLTFDFSVLSGEGVTIAIVGYTIVFAALVLLYIVFKQIPKIIDIQARRRLKKEGKLECAEEKQLQIPGDELAAISMALYLHLHAEIHDEEDMVLTMKRVQRRYSPWSSKIYNVSSFRK